MKISKNSVVSFHYSVRDEDGDLIEKTPKKEPVVYLHGHKGLLRGLEEALDGRESGERFTVTLSPAEAYGDIQPDREMRIPIKRISGVKELKQGTVAVVNTDQGQQQVKVLKLGHTMATVDTNHPLAGLTLSFDIEVTEVREASHEELSHGHVHGPGGHQH